jgi:hypothetical protein
MLLPAVCLYIVLCTATDLFMHVFYELLITCRLVSCFCVCGYVIYTYTDKPASEADHWVNVALWLEEHLLKL